MVATKRRFDPNLQKVRHHGRPRAATRVRMHALPESRQGHQGPVSERIPGLTPRLCRLAPRARACAPAKLIEVSA